MIGAELAVCAGDTVGVKDYHSLTYGSPVLDEYQDWEMLSGGRNNGLTYCELKRLKTVCDKYNNDITSDSDVIQGLLAWDNTNEKDIN